MNIVITGAGKVGSAICADLSSENHNIVMIERSEARLDNLLNSYDINGVVGNGATYDALTAARISDCDVFIAVTSNDETNIVAAITAKRLGAKHTVARVRNPEYSKQVDFLRENLGITLMINPEMEAAQAITRMLLFPAALNVEHFVNGRVNMIGLVLRAEAPMVGMKLKDLKGVFGTVIVCVIIRGEQVFIPDGETDLRAGDRVMITGKNMDILKFCEQSGASKGKIRSVLIIGGGRVTNYLIGRLLKLRTRVKVIEINSEIAEKLAVEFPQAEISVGDGTSQGFLNEEHAPDYDCVIALTGIDEENILISIYASRRGIKKTITKVNRTDLLKVLDNVGLQAIITPHRLIADHIVRFVRSIVNSEGSNIDAFFRLEDGRVEVLQFKVREKSRAAGIPLVKLTTKRGVLIPCIIRNKTEIIFPTGTSVISPGDSVIVATTHKGFQDLDDILDETRGRI